MIPNGIRGVSAPLCQSCGVALQRYYRNSAKTIHLPLPFPVSLNRSGIPKCIPSFHRKILSTRDETADQLVRVRFFLSRWMIVRKKGRFGYDSIVKRPSSAVPEDPFNDFIKDPKGMFPGLLIFLILDFGGYRNGHRHLLRIPHSAYRELRKTLWNRLL